MDRRRVDRAFWRFFRSGDPVALAEVFDRTAPELLAVARHLVRDPHDAEDLVQTVFLVAIERRAAYQPGAGALPWLLGILTNAVRRARRAAARSPDAARLQARAEGGPVDSAMETELSTVLQEAVRGLPQPYRAVVDLHLRRGASAREIGELLGRAAGTVRTQLVRGLDHLRRALPRGLAVGGAAVALPVAVPALRAAVLDAARRAAPATPAAATGAAAAGLLTGVLLMKKMLLAGGLAMVALATWAAWPSRALEDRSADRESAAPEAMATDGGPLAGQVVPTAQRVPVVDEKAAPRATPPAERVEGRSGCAVVGRAVDTRGRPLAGVRVRLSHDGSTRRALSAPDGSFAVERPLGPGAWKIEHDLFGVRLRGPELVIESGQESAPALPMSRTPKFRCSRARRDTTTGCACRDSSFSEIDHFRR
jgi:RNA polymerase sigma-70 factor (ECF subfamily)